MQVIGEYLQSRSFMTIMLSLSSLLVVITKGVDVYSTLKFLKRGNLAMERNRFVRLMMVRFGMRKVVWGIFVFTIVLVLVIQYELMKSDIRSFQWAYVFLAIFVSAFQAAVAHSNLTGRSNIWVRLISSWSIYRV